MDDTQKMLRIIINDFSAFKQEISIKIDAIGDRLDKRINILEEKIDGAVEKLTKRMDKIGAHVAYLEDDAPTREEFVVLEKRVDKIEQKASLA